MSESPRLPAGVTDEAASARRRTLPQPRPGVCRWCLEEIRKPDGSLGVRNRRYHRNDEQDGRADWTGPSCFDRAMVWLNPINFAAVQSLLEDCQGRCEGCGLEVATLQERPESGWRYWRPSRAASSLWRAAFEIDHKLPLVDGGTNERENLQILCVPCHREKTAGEARDRAQKRRELVTGQQQLGLEAA